MPARIFCKVGELKGLMRRFDDEIVLGRSSQCSLNLQVAMISGRHARIAYDARTQRYLLHDLGSTNGTRLDGVRVLKPEPLGHLHVITLAGAHDLIFQDLERSAKRHEGYRPIAAAPVSSVDEDDEDEDAIVAKPAMRSRVAEKSHSGTQIFDEIPLMPGLLAYQATNHEAQAFEAFYELSPEERTSRSLELPLELPDFLRGPETEAAKAESVKDDAAKSGAAKGEAATAGTGPSPPVEELAPMVAETLDLEEARQQEPNVTSASQIAKLMLGEDVRTLLLELTFQDGEVKVFSLKEGDNVLGRGTDVDLQVPSLAVSRRHAVLRVNSGQVSVEDLGSRNHTFVDGVQVTDAVAVPIAAVLQFGALTARLLAAKGA